MRESEEFSSKGYLDMELLRFTTAGSVDDGKSTLIGRLLYDSKSIFEDQLEAVKKASIQRGSEYINLALLTDGLRAEREQGITIDVAYRYFATPKRKFIIADTPGHIQYTRNMVTGASTANAALILIDVRNGVIEQTCRHTYIAHLLGIPHLIVCVNKMDLVEYSEEPFNRIRSEMEAFADRLGIKDMRFVPISALKGDNVVDHSEHIPWYKGNTLMNLLETIDITSDHNFETARFPVQYVVRPLSDEHHDYRGYAGRIAGGIFRPGDQVMVLPGGQNTTIREIHFYDQPLERAYPPMSVSMTLDHDIDISRGDLIVKAGQLPKSGQDIEVMLCWFNPRPMTVNGKYILRHTTRELRALVKEISYKVNVNNLEQLPADGGMMMNDIACVVLKITKPLYFDSYRENRITGSLVLIDEATNETVAAGMILDSHPY